MSSKLNNECEKLISATATNTLTTKINVITTESSNPFLLTEEESNACSQLMGAACPLSAEQRTRFMLNVFIPANSNSGPVTLETLLLDDNNNIVMCFEIDAIIT
jgi:hypothetical protein